MKMGLSYFHFSKLSGGACPLTTSQMTAMLAMSSDLTLCEKSTWELSTCTCYTQFLLTTQNKWPLLFFCSPKYWTPSFFRVLFMSLMPWQYQECLKQHLFLFGEWNLHEFAIRKSKNKTGRQFQLVKTYKRWRPGLSQAVSQTRTKLIDFSTKHIEPVKGV